MLDEGWGKGDDGVCYQEFTVGFCTEDRIVRINKTQCQAQTWDENLKKFEHNLKSLGSEITEASSRILHVRR